LCKKAKAPEKAGQKQKHFFDLRVHTQKIKANIHLIRWA
jgi:hypothetical protein